MDVLHLNSYAVEGFIHGDPRFPRNTQPNATKGAKNLINEAGFGSLTSSFSHDQATSLRVLLCISFVRLKIPKLSFMLVLWIVASLGHRPKHPFFLRRLVHFLYWHAKSSVMPVISREWVVSMVLVSFFYSHLEKMRYDFLSLLPIRQLMHAAKLKGGNLAIQRVPY